jgi:rhamnulokinase
MSAEARYLAADLGASSGRLMVCSWNGNRFAIEELHRFPNGGIMMTGELCWDVLEIWKHLQDGIAKFRTRYRELPCGIAVDAWGVDFALLDTRGRLVSNPVHYRDARTKGAPQQLFEIVPEREWFAETGTQTMEINTLIQLYSMVRSQDPRLAIADTLLMIPDLFLYFLSGVKRAEFTEASTSQMLSLKSHRWADSLLERVGIPASLLPPVTQPGTCVGQMCPSLVETLGFGRSFPVIATASHDTACAVASIPELDSGSGFISCGTWSLIGVRTEAPDTSEAAMQLGFTNEGSADSGNLLLKNLTGLWTIQECLRSWSVQGRRMDWAALLEASAAVRGLQVFFDPEDWRLHQHGEMPEKICAYLRDTGQTVPPTPAEIARCAFESLALKYRFTIERLRALTGRSLHTLRVVGGGCLNSLLCQMTADATGCTVIAGPVEASALGNAMIQAVAAGDLPDLEAGQAVIAANENLVFYAPQHRDAWDDAFARFQQIQVNN